jgi:hypothetical protein
MDLQGIYKELKRSSNPMIGVLDDQYKRNDKLESLSPTPSATHYTVTIQSTIQGLDFWYSNNVKGVFESSNKDATKNAAILVINKLKDNEGWKDSTRHAKVPLSHKMTVTDLLGVMQGYTKDGKNYPAHHFEKIDREFHTAHYEHSILSDRLRKAIAKASGRHCFSGHFHQNGTTTVTVLVEPNNPRYTSETFNCSMHEDPTSPSALQTSKPGLEFIMDEIESESKDKLFSGNLDFPVTQHTFSDLRGSNQVMKYVQEKYKNYGAPRTIHKYECIDGFISPSIMINYKISTRPSWIKPHKKTNVNVTYILTDISFTNGERMVLLFTSNAPIKPYLSINDTPRKDKTERLEDSIKNAVDLALHPKCGSKNNKHERARALSLQAKQPVEIVPMTADVSKKANRKQKVASNPMSTYTQALDQVSNGSKQCEVLFKKGFTPIAGFTEREQW